MSELSEKLWSDYWHLLGHVTEFEAAKSFNRFQVAGREAVLFHDGADVVAFDNRCPHRGARIFDADTGNVPFVCRYHGWSYSRGKLFVADREQFAHCDLTAAQLATYRLAQLGDFIFVSPAPVLELEEQLGGMAGMIEQISRNIARRRDFNAYDYSCYWPIAIENALEPYHVRTIHPESLNQLELSRGKDERFGKNSVWFTDVGNSKTAKRLDKLRKMFDLSFFHSGYMNIYLFPFSMISSTFGLSYSIQNFFPGRDDDVAHFYSRLFVSRMRNGIKEQLFEDFFGSTAELNRQVFKEDSEICARIPADAWSMHGPEICADSEQRIVLFRQACREAMGEAARS